MLTREHGLLRGFCMGILLTAVLFRFAAAVPWETLYGARDAPSAVAETINVRTEYPTIYYETETPVAAEVEVNNTCGAVFDQAALLAQPLTLTVTDEPAVLIVHTHATEAYTPTDGETYEASAAYRTEDTAHNVVRVGQALCDRLNANGIRTIHDTSLNDLDGYDGSYERMEETISAYLRDYPSLQMVIDVHRDAASDDDGRQVAVTTVLDGEEYARVMLVMGTDLAGLYHPAWQDNLACALQLQSAGERQTPGLFRPLNLRAGRYNEHLTNASLLIEVGTAGNTLPQAIRSAELLGDLIASLFRE